MDKLRDYSAPADLEVEIDLLLNEIEELEGGIPEETVAFREPEPLRPRRMPRKITVRVAAGLILLSVLGTAFALTQTTLSTQYLELWQSQSAATDFTVTQFVLLPVGDNQIDIDLTLQNDDASTHYANVTVQLLDVNGDLILEQSLATGAVTASSTVVLNYSFTQASLVANYEKSQIIVNQSS